MYAFRHSERQQNRARPRNPVGSFTRLEILFAGGVDDLTGLYSRSFANPVDSKYSSSSPYEGDILPALLACTSDSIGHPALLEGGVSALEVQMSTYISVVNW